MRPRELKLRGFRSYAEEMTFSWEGRNLVGVVGPTGSGKSSILDAISFALYGKTPRIERDTKSLINQRRDVLQAELVFDVDGATYKAVRTLRKGGASAHALYRIDDGVDVPLADRVQEMAERVEALLGLDFDAFRRSVLLAQNQFADFLEAKPTERNQVLKGVFGFDRLDAMRAIAKERLDALGNRLAVLADRRATAEADRTELEVKRSELKVAEERAGALELLRAPFEQVKERIAGADERATGDRERLDRFDRLAERIPSRERSEALFAGAGSADAAEVVAQEALGEAVANREAASLRITDVLDSVGGKAGLTAVGDLVAVWKAARDGAAEADHAVAGEQRRMEEARAGALGISQRLEQAEQDARSAATDEQTAAQTLEGSRAALQAIHQGHRAHALRVGLVAGDPCPVCEQRVATLPDPSTPAPVEHAEEAVVAAREALEAGSVLARSTSEAVARLRAEASGAKQAVAGALTALEATGRRRDESATRVEAAKRAVEAHLGSGEPEAALDTVRARAAEAESGLEAAVAAEGAARQHLDQTRAAAVSSAAALGSLRTDLATLAGLLESDVEVGEDPAAIEQAFEQLRTEWSEQREAAEAALAGAKDESEAARAALADLLDASGLGEKDDVVEVIAAALAERTAREAEVYLLEKRLADLEQLAKDESELVAASELLATVHADLAPSKFLEFVLDERRRALGSLASEHFETLTAGRYRFDESGDFHIVDLTAANEVRFPTSLSGGETFLASLALALALAEIVAREGGRLDAFFLDEGFGNLDPEHLDLAMDGIERLVTRGSQRLVVVVSHVPALRERIEDLIVLDRDPVTGGTLIVSGATAS